MTLPRPPASAHEKKPANRTAGIFKLAHQDLPALRQAADELGQAFFSVNLEDARNVPGFIRALSRDLDFPEWFGGNLDALHDCLTDFSWHPAPGYVIAIDNCTALSANVTSFAIFNEVLSSVVETWQESNIPFRVFYLYDVPATGRNLSPANS
jgi:hypothetical protein